MDGAVVTVKEPWVKAKVVRRKKGIQMVSSPLPPINFDCTPVNIFRCD